MSFEITAVMPVIPPRLNNGLFDRAIKSVETQSHIPAAISISVDTEKRGAAFNRNRALMGVRTKWVAFIDDDDFWYPHHLETLKNLIIDNDADFAYSWFDGNNPFPMHRGRQMNPADPHHTTMTIMVRTEIAQSIGFGGPDMHHEWAGEDWRFILGCLEQGAKFIGTPEITWHYAVHGGNTSGLTTTW